MPYKEGNRWRGVVKIDGKRIAQKWFPLKRDAARWERENRKELKKTVEKVRGGMDLMTFCLKYLDDATRFTPHVYKEKQRLCRRIMHLWEPEILVEDITPEMVLDYLNNRAEGQTDKEREKRPLAQTNNAFNKDRKNLLAMWNWGQEILDLPSNPVAKIKKRPHNRQPQYVPATEDVLKVLAVATREERVLLNCYLLTGARRSEIFRWTWIEDINFEQRQYRLGTRKSRDGSMDYEWFPMSDELYESLWWWWKNRKFRQSPYVFVDDHQGPNYGNRYRVRKRFLRSLCEKAGVEPFGFHALRRYVSSLLFDTHKASVKTVQRILRHKNARTTERYLRALNRDLKETLNLLSKRSVPGSGTRKGEKEEEDNR